VEIIVRVWIIAYRDFSNSCIILIKKNVKNNFLERMTVNIKFSPLTPDNWNDFEKLFGTHGACGGCWCMFWRISRKQFYEGCKSQNKLDIKKLVFSGTIPGILGYMDNQAVGWCSIASREEFDSLERSRTLKRIDEKPVWSIVCFFVQKNFHRMGIMGELIRGAVDYARSKGARIIEAYPNMLSSKKQPAEIYMGDLKTFLKDGFQEAAKAGSKVIVRKYI
jgi:GNAT superfamily N-acetyltransferase